MFLILLYYVTLLSILIDRLDLFYDDEKLDIIKYLI